MSNNNDLDPAASTQMFRAFVDGATPNSPTPAVTGSAPARSGNAGKVIGITLAVVVIVLIAFLAF
ncbi:MAG TPA: hypothetical protein VH372_06940 [Actinospica sp.]|nr:hypothetical protein [Actinospica sp.]